MGMLGTDRPSARTVWPAWMSLLWALGFGGLNLAWTAGARWGIDKLAVSIRDQVDQGDQSIVLFNTLGGLAKIVLGILALGTIKTWGRAVPQALLMWLLYLGGVGMFAYGLLNWIQDLLALTGVIDIPTSIGEDAIRWYAWLWEPLWMLGGILITLTARVFQTRSAN